MNTRIPAEVQEAITEVARKFGRQGEGGGKIHDAGRAFGQSQESAKAAAERRTAKHLAREGLKRDKQEANRQRSRRAI